MGMYSVVRGDGTLLLFLHGFCVDHRIFLPLDPVFEAQDRWRRVYVDLPGMGQTPAGSDIDSSDAVGDAVVSFIRENFADEPFAVVGNSFGGMLAHRVVADFGDQVMGLALLCPAIIADHALRDVPDFVVLEEEAGLIESLDPADAAEYAPMAVIRTTENWERFRTAVLPGLRDFDPDATARISARYALSAALEAVPFDGPTTIITGRQDQVVGYSDAFRMLEHYPRTTFTVLDRAGHNAHLDQPELVAALLDNWSRSL